MPATPTLCLTFDFDAISVWLGTFGVSTPTYVSRGEFAANVATPRILDLLERESVTSTWYIPGLDVDTYPDVCRRIRDAGHEIGHHGYAHGGRPTSRRRPSGT
ncbi:MAG TPA: polysaccharide deacetylase family protein [Pseudonocardia sp.]|nr:polysaccharide deacetylase family protein [Pseudonocardia sp.]